MNQLLITGLKCQLLALVSVFMISVTTFAEVKLVGAEIVAETKVIKGEVWPEITTKVLIKTPPLAAVAIFAAYDYQKNYVPNLIKSQVSFEEVKGKENATHVSYKMDMPWPISDSVYIHGHELTAPAKDSYKVRWYMVESDSADNVKGFALFEPHPANPKFTLMTYKSLVSPKSFFAGALKKIMVGDVIKTLEAIRVAIEEAAQKKPELIKNYSDKIKKVLSGKPAYIQ